MIELKKYWRLPVILYIKNNPKLREVVHQDLFDLSTIVEQLSGYDACFYCIGISAAGLKENSYHHITYDLTLKIGELLLELNPNLIFCYISAAGADPSEKGKIMWARVKGKIENKLHAMDFKRSYMFRPALILPKKGTKSRTSWYNVIYMLLKPFGFILNKMPKWATDTEKLGRAVIAASLTGSEKKHFTNS